MAGTGWPVQDGSLPTTLRVLVGVDSHGKVIKASPATAVPPAVERALVRTLDRVITHPARDASGKSIPSSFVMHLELHATRTTGGKYQLAFDHLSTKPLPTGAWIWCSEHGSQSQLVNIARHPDACPAPARTIRGMDLVRTGPRGAFTFVHDTPGTQR